MKKLAAACLLIILCAFASDAQQIVNGARAFPLLNDGGTGTTLNGTAKITAAGTAINSATTDTSIPVYIVVGGAGTTGYAAMGWGGIGACTMDSTISGSAGGFYVINSTTNATECHAQAGTPGAGTWVIGFLWNSSTTSGQTSLAALNGFVFGGTGSGSSIFTQWTFGSNSPVTGTGNYVQLTATPSSVMSLTQTGGGSIGSPFIDTISLSVQGTDLKLMSSGVISGTPGTAVCLDLNLGITTVGCPNGAVFSVFGRTGAVVGSNGDYTLSQITATYNPPLLLSGNVLSVSNATTGAVGVVQLAGDLGGTATSPSVLKVDGVSYPATGSLFDALPILTASNTVGYYQINGGAPCGDATHALSYVPSTHLFGCVSITGSAGGVNVTVNGGLTLGSPVNFQNGSAVTGLTINVSNPTASNVQFAISGTLSDAGISSAYSGTGACATNEWASILNRNAAPTCTQPGFSNLSGSFSLAQTPLAANGDLMTVISGSLSALAKGGNGTFLGVSGGVLGYYTPTLGSIVSSVTGDPIIFSNSGSTGAVTLALRNAAAGTVLGNATSSAATPTYTSNPQLGSSGTLGSVTFGNATSGLLTLETVTGALGTVTVSIPASTDTLVNLASAQTLVSKTLTSPVINTSATGTAIQGTDTKLMSAGTVSGTGATLCTDSNGGATTSSCTSGLPVLPTSPNGVAEVPTSTPSGGVGGAITWSLPGVAGRAVTGTTSTDTILSTDCSPNRVEYIGSVAVGITLPTATTLLVPDCVFKVANETTGSTTALTITPTTWTINGSSTLSIAQGQIATVYIDPNSSTNWVADVTEQGLTASTNITFTRSASGLNISAAGSSASGTSGLIQVSNGAGIFASVSGWSISGSTMGLPSAACLNISNASGDTLCWGAFTGITSSASITAPAFIGSGSGAGYIQCLAGIVPSLVTSAIQITCPASGITNYQIVLAATAATGVPLLTNAGNTVTESYLSSAANGDVIVGNGTTWAKFAGNASGTQCFQENASGVASWGACGGGSGALSSITAATGANTINNGNNDQRWNFSLTTNSTSAFIYGESTASTATSSFLMNINTLNTSTLNPLVVTSQGTSNGFEITSSAVIEAIGTGAFAIGGTVHGVIVSEGATTAVNVLTVGTTGQVLLGNTGADPSFGILTIDNLGAAGASKTFANGANTLTFNNATTSSGAVGFTIGETTASTSAGTPFEAQIKTLIGSTATPLNVLNSLNGSQTLAALSITPTWNTTGVVDAAFLINVTNTASGTGSLLFDAQIGGTSEFKIDKAGNSTQLGSVTALSLSTGTPPSCTGGTAGVWCAGEGTAPTAASAVDDMWADSTTHQWKVQNNGGSPGLLDVVLPGTIRSTGLTAAVSTATLCAASAGACNQAGTYHVHIALYQSGTACSANTTAGVAPSLTWTDGNGTAHSAQGIPMDTNASLVATSGTMAWGATTLGAWGSGDINIDTNGTVVQYAIAFSQCTTGTATYAASLAVTRLQ